VTSAGCKLRGADERADRPVQVEQAAARQHALGRHMAVLHAQPSQQGGFPLVGGGQGDMAAFAAEGRPAARAARQQAGDTQPCARPEQTDRRIGHGSRAADETQVRRAECRQAHGQCREVVEDQAAL
jgi:hypothetical protein